MKNALDLTKNIRAAAALDHKSVEIFQKKLKNFKNFCKNFTVFGAILQKTAAFKALVKPQLTFSVCLENIRTPFKSNKKATNCLVVGKNEMNESLGMVY